MTTREQEEIIELKRSVAMLEKIVRKLESIVEELRDEDYRKNAIKKWKKWRISQNA